YVDLDEVTLRLVPAALGVILVAAHAGARGLLGAGGAAAAALLAALSPAMVFYSRYFIHEVPLVLFSFGALLAAHRYLRSPGPGPVRLLALPPLVLLPRAADPFPVAGNAPLDRRAHPPARGRRRRGGLARQGCARGGSGRPPVPRLVHAPDARHLLRHPVQDP